MILSRLVFIPAALTLASPAAIHVRDEPASSSDSPPDILLRYHHETRSSQTELTLSDADKS